MSFAEDYVQVHERLGAFYEKWPDGRITTEIIEHTAGRVTVRAAVYRSPEDPLPCTGHSSLGIPGATPYTKGSELENSETSAVGRALALAGFETKRSIASAEEVAAKHTEAPTPPKRATEAAAGRAPAAASDDEGGLCPVHRKPWREKNGRYFCANKVEDGSWCDARPSKGWVARHELDGVQPPLPEPPAEDLSDLPF